MRASPGEILVQPMRAIVEPSDGQIHAGCNLNGCYTDLGGIIRSKDHVDRNNGSQQDFQQSISETPEAHSVVSYVVVSVVASGISMAVCHDGFAYRRVHHLHHRRYAVVESHTRWRG